MEGKREIEQIQCHIFVEQRTHVEHHESLLWLQVSIGRAA